MKWWSGRPDEAVEMVDYDAVGNSVLFKSEHGASIPAAGVETAGKGVHPL